MLGLAAALATNAPAPARAEIDLLLIDRIEARLAAGEAGAFAELEEVIRSEEATPDEQIDLLAELARLRLAHGDYADAGEALTYQAQLVARREQAHAPELAVLYAAAADAYARADDPATALPLAEEALELDSAYFGCADAVVASDHQRLAVVRSSGRRLLNFLEDVVARSGARRINVIAHSMGNRALTDALELLAAYRSGAGENAPLFEQAIFAAPDVDADLFAAMVDRIRPVAHRLTLYGSENDTALHASQRLHGDQSRAGQGGANILISDDLDTIDMSGIGGDMLGHSYFTTSASALTDMLWLFWRDEAPERRCGMGAKNNDRGRFWLFDPTRCNGPVILSALTLIKTEGAAALPKLDTILKGLTADGKRVEAEEWREIRKAIVAALGAVQEERPR